MRACSTCESSLLELQPPPRQVKLTQGEKKKRQVFSVNHFVKGNHLIWPKVYKDTLTR